jgi:RNA polymerase sigma factor (sigma-70 family)
VVVKNKIALEQFFNKHRRMVVGLCFNYVGSNDCEDAAQEAMLRAYANIHKFKGNSKLETWVFSIIRNACLNWIKQKKALKRSAESISFDAVNDPSWCSDFYKQDRLLLINMNSEHFVNNSNNPMSPIDMVANYQLLQKINAYKELLGSTKRKCFELRMLGHNFAFIASELGLKNELEAKRMYNSSLLFLKKRCKHLVNAHKNII